ncbi:flagellar export protein FliJ [Metabacillus iocasae]|uniref:Flagellar FliJ protein n=1 Tax=Priestia iocasae TaxID=2291674 RepID=A0ABS2QQZ2_9BACI|nr:flagellar export protein FliJ [Metabacillus iocasae]MBM7701867.1 flagellar FliJ protein [Metabacillus iocasae]
MAYQFKFAKVMAVRENEQDRIRAEYHESMKEFERIGQQLYDKLKQKEQLIEQQASKMISGLPITEVKNFQLFLENIEKAILNLQREVMIARQNMYVKEAKLREKNLEVKKFEKIKGKDYHRYVQMQNELEMKHMDEVSIQQYMLKGN